MQRDGAVCCRGRRDTVPEDQQAEAEAAKDAASAPEEPVSAPPPLRVGAVVEGTVSGVDVEQALVDVGGKADGILPASEAVLAPGQALPDVLTAGQRVTVSVVGFDAEAGAPRLSQRRALAAAAWRNMERAFAAGETVEGPVREVVKGGLVLDLGVRAFLPASQADRVAGGDLSAYVGQTLAVRIIEVDRAKNRLVVSRRVLLDEERRLRQDAVWQTLEEGQVRSGTVKALTDFGAFIDLGGVDGLLHISAMSWGRIGHPSELLTQGQTVAVKVLKVDREHQKVSLGLKQVAPDPWTQALERYPVGALVQGRVARLSPFGAFVQLEPGVDGLIHISHLADRHVRDPREVVQEGQEITVKVLRVAPEERRISLSLREVQESGAAPAQPAPEAARGGSHGEFTVGERVTGLEALLNERQGETSGPGER